MSESAEEWTHTLQIKLHIPRSGSVLWHARAWSLG